MYGCRNHLMDFNVPNSAIEITFRLGGFNRMGLGF